MPTTFEPTNELFRFFVENSWDLISVHREDGALTYVSPSVTKALGYHPEELIGNPPWEYIHPEDLDLAKKTVAKALDNLGKPQKIEFRFLRKDGNWEYLESVGEAHKIVNDSYQVLVSSRLITQRIEAENARQKLEDQLRQSHRLENLSTLSSGIAHDLNNALQPISGYISLILMDLPPDSPIKSDLENTLECTNRARDLVNQILVFSQQTKAEKTVINFSALLQKSFHLLRSSLPTTIVMELNLPPIYRAKIYGDPGQLHEMIMNLGTNAYQSMKEKGGRLTLTLSNLKEASPVFERHPQLADKNCLHLSIKDTGEGIPPQALDKIFEPFYTTKPLGEGTGLGLSVVHGIVSSHGGAIEAQSRLDEGSTFDIYLPTVDTNYKNPATTSNSNQGKGEHILLVDDEQTITKMFNRLLEKLNYKVTPLNHSRAAMELFRQDPDRFDLVITDYTMPHLTGLELGEKMLAIKPDLPIILTTGYSREISEKEVLDKGLKMLLHKPVSLHKMSRIIRETLTS